MDDILQIDVKAILEAKAGKKARYVPGFLVSYLKKIVHQDEVNEFLRIYHDKRGIEFVNSFMEYFNNSFEVVGLENLPKDGPCTFVSNHPLGAQDGLENALHCWEYIKKEIIDTENGEWFWSIRPDGTINRDEDKAGFWKCPYHNGRMCLEIIERTA